MVISRGSGAQTSIANVRKTTNKSFKINTKILILSIPQTTMAKTTNPLWAGYKGFSGAALKQIVFKTYGENTFVTKYPDMSNVIQSEIQLHRQSKFAKAVEFAKDIVHDPVKKAAYPVPKGKRVFQTAIRDYLEQHQ
jgi:hypothetical protein